MRVCILGNSHVAALRAAWGQQPDRWPGLHPSFVAAPRSLLQHMAVLDGTLVPTDATTRAALQRLCGQTEVTLAAQDAFVIVGLSVTLATALQPYRDARWPGLPSLDQWPDLHSLPHRFVSAEAAQAIVSDMLHRRLGVQLVQRLRAATPCPIYLIPQPRSSDMILKHRSPATRLHRIAIGNGDGAAIAGLFDRSLAMTLAAAGAQLLPQPAPTIRQHLLTDHRFMAGPERLEPVHEQDTPDTNHANALYGAVVLDQIAAAVGPP
jgi:hypothetical protein